MLSSGESNMKLLGMFGPVGIDVSEKLLIDRGINAAPIFKFAEYPKPEKLRYGSNYQKAVFEGITHCKERNGVIIEHVLEAKKHKLPTLILVQRQNHGNVLLAQLKAAGLKAKFIFGESSTTERQDGLNKLASGKIDVLIGSKILDVGVDVPAIGLVIMAGGGKAEVAYRQRIGRGLREKKKGPNVCFILDFMDDHNEYLHRHNTERLSVIKGTPGFNEGLLGPGQNFNWSIFE
jgi:superfamily II DNA or RNA helicase